MISTRTIRHNQEEWISFDSTQAQPAVSAIHARKIDRYRGLSHWSPPARAEEMNVQINIVMKNSIKTRLSFCLDRFQTNMIPAANKGIKIYHPAARKIEIALVMGIPG